MPGTGAARQGSRQPAPGRALRAREPRRRTLRAGALARDPRRANVTAMDLPALSQSPTDPGFVQEPYPFYDRARALGPLVFWRDYGMPAAFGHAIVDAILRDRRFVREPPVPRVDTAPERLRPFYELELSSMLEREPPAHTRLRGQVLRAFTARRVAALEPEIAALCHRLIDAFPTDRPFDLLPAFAETVPVTVIAGMLGVPVQMGPQLLDWSHRMVAMYQARRDRAIEDSAIAAVREFTAYMGGILDDRRRAPGDDMISALLGVETAARLSDAEILSTAILLLNAGHEATVHAIGNGVAAILVRGLDPAGLFASPEAARATAEEILRIDPPLHMFTRFAREPVDLAGHHFARGDEVALMLGAAGRDPAVFDDPDRFDPARTGSAAHLAFGAGIHFCVGAPLARLEMAIALPILFGRCPALRPAEPPRFANRYHFHGLERLMVAL